MIDRRSWLGGMAAALWGQEPERRRVVVSTDIGGTDPDDFQSMVHLLLYADVLEIEGLISSPFGPGRARHILEVIAEYEKDYPALVKHSSRYPKPDALRAMTNEGALESPGPLGVGEATEGSRWIVECAKKKDPRPLYVLVWGGIEDVAQALHDSPEILPKLRVYFIGGPNKLWSVDAYDYIETHHPMLWMIEANSTYRGWFVGGRQDGAWGNTGFVQTRVAGRGALGNYFAKHLKGTIKMGDSPSVAWLLHGNPADPTEPSWGGRFVRTWDGRKAKFARLTTEADRVEVFGVVEIVLPIPDGFGENNHVRVLLDNRVPTAVERDGKTLRFRFAPRDVKVWTYRVESDFAGLNGVEGKFTAVAPEGERVKRGSRVHPNWWGDDQAQERAEGVHAGAKSVSEWREQFLEDLRRGWSGAGGGSEVWQ